MITTGGSLGYYAAVKLLSGLGREMYQPTPDAVKMTPVIEPTKLISSLKSSSDVDVCCCGIITSQSDNNRKKKKRVRVDSSDEDRSHKRLRTDSEDSEKSKKKQKLLLTYADPINADDWRKYQAEELSAYGPRIHHRYASETANFYPRTRRKAFNVIYFMAAKLNLEVCTPQLAVVTFDRYKL